MSKIFFYGLFMDRSFLTGKGICPEMIGPAVLHDYRIHIGERATLLPSASSHAYGIVMELSDEEARALYSEPSVREYIPDRVQVELARHERSCRGVLLQSTARVGPCRHESRVRYQAVTVG